jgi:glycerophosphoryl diester phosphodiesterase
MEHGAMGELPAFVAHRFGRAYGPDSSRAALAQALTGPLGGVETDCSLSADGRIVLLHDPLLSHGTELDGWVIEHDAEDLLRARLRDSQGALTAQRPLLLEEALDLLATREELIVQLEVKAYANADLAERTARETCARALAHGGVAPERLEIISFWPQAAAIGAGHGLRARVIVACAYTPDALARWAVERGVTGVILEGAYWAAEPVATWRAAGLSLMSGVVNDAPSLARVLPFSPDFVATDRPHELRAEVA